MIIDKIRAMLAKPVKTTGRLLPHNEPELSGAFDTSRRDFLKFAGAAAAMTAVPMPITFIEQVQAATPVVEAEGVRLPFSLYLTRGNKSYFAGNVHSLNIPQSSFDIVEQPVFFGEFAPKFVGRIRPPTAVQIQLECTRDNVAFLSNVMDEFMSSVMDEFNRSYMGPPDYMTAHVEFAGQCVNLRQAFIQSLGMTFPVPFEGEGSEKILTDIELGWSYLTFDQS